MALKRIILILAILTICFLTILSENTISPSPDQWTRVQNNFYIGTNEFIAVSGTGDGTGNSYIEISTNSYVKLSLNKESSAYSNVIVFIVPEVLIELEPHNTLLNFSLLKSLNISINSFPDSAFWGMSLKGNFSTTQTEKLGQWNEFIIKQIKISPDSLYRLYIVQMNEITEVKDRSVYIDMYEIIIHKRSTLDVLLSNWLDRKPTLTVINGMNNIFDALGMENSLKILLGQFFLLLGVSYISFGQIIMILISFFLVYLAISKNVEPILLLPIGFGALLVNIPLSGLMDINNQQGLLYFLYSVGILTEMFPILIFIGIGSMIDFGPLLERPKMMVFGAAGQIGIFFTLIIALLLQSLNLLPVLREGYALKEASSIAIIGAADGPSAIYLTTLFAPHILGPVVVAAYSYMALVPIIQPPIMKIMTTKNERAIKMEYSTKEISKRTKIIFPIVVTLITSLITPLATPLIGSLMLGNLIRESDVVPRLRQAVENEIPNTVTLLLGLTIGATMKSQSFLNLQTIIILILGIVAFMSATAGGLLLGKIYCHLSGNTVNPLIGACGISAFPMSARVVASVAKEEDPENFIIFHAIASNTAGQIGSVIATGMLLLLIPVFTPLIG